MITAVVYGALLETPALAPPVPDAGARDAATNRDAGSRDLATSPDAGQLDVAASPDAGTSSDGRSSTDASAPKKSGSGGCSCALAGPAHPAWPSLAAFLLVVLGVHRRRRAPRLAAIFPSPSNRR